MIGEKGLDQSSEAQRQIEAIRRKLLDLSLNNRLLNFRPSKKASVQVVDEDSTEIHRILVAEGKKMSFVGRPDPPRKAEPDSVELDFGDDVSLQRLREDAIEELDGFLANSSLPTQTTDLKLNTAEFVSVLEAKLRHIEREAKSAEEELGINTLFLALGFLEWVDDAGKVRKAPLLFLPIKLEKLGNGTIKVCHDGGDVGTNLPLEAKLREIGFRLPDFDDEDSPAAYFVKVAATVKSRQSWAVRPDEVHLAFFNYEKYIMWHDLGGDNWPDGQKPWDHPQATRLLVTGYEAVESHVNENSFLDKIRTPEASCEVYDADSSQALVLVRVREGHSIVVQGPPGTGKSQTITNIIAEAVASGKSVLFVSAKRAALDVVKRRLEEADLQDLCLDLHDKLTNRKAFYGELKRTTGLNFTKRDQSERVQRFKEIQDLLNRHAEAVNTAIEPFGITPFEAMVALARLPKETPEDVDGRIPFDRISDLAPSTVNAGMPAINALQSLIKETGSIKDSPFGGCELTYIDPGLRLDLEQALTACTDALAKAQVTAKAAGDAFKVETPKTLAGVTVLLSCAARANEAPKLDGVAVNSGTWADAEPKVRAVISALTEYHQLRTTVEEQFIESGRLADLSWAATQYQAHAAKFFRGMIGDFRKARSQVLPHLAGLAPKDPQSIAALLERQTRFRLACEVIESNRPLMERLFGVQYEGFATSPAKVEALLAWVLDLTKDVTEKRLPEGLLDFFTGFEGSGHAVQEANEAEAAAQQAIQTYTHACSLLGFPQGSFQDEPLEVTTARATGWASSLPQLSDYLKLMEARRQVESKLLGAVLEVADAWPLAGDRLSDTLLRSYYSGILRKAMSERPQLRTFERKNHENAVREFQELDDFGLKYNRARLRLIHLQGLPQFAAAQGNLLLLRQQCELQRRHRSIRWAMEKAGAAIQKVKPVFMMSPLSVAIHLPPQLPQFDLVVFDEASQIKPEDALPSIIRAKQTVVVGDTRQMPPTTFFDRLAEGDDDVEEGDEGAQMAAEATKLESILSMMSAVVADAARRPDLRWHYRSLHPALIQPSNELFYENRLVVFPSPSRSVGDLHFGVRLHYDISTAYVQGKRQNPAEAKAVADAVVKHLETSPDESLLVAAMNKAQADLIYDYVEIRRRLYPDLFAKYDRRHPFEPLSVKNLENVQGDERDTVFVSITYGKDEAGILRQQFGPLLADGGERRLNVLITRARKRCEVFTNMLASDLRVDPGKRGLVALQHYLRYAETGAMNLANVTGDEPESPFEEEVRAALQLHGYEVDAQVGSLGYRIDLAVVNPDAPGEYLLGIECDGATYHSARSARDRDKLRQRVLESRGWTLHRIWSTDWWQDRDREVGRLLEALAEKRSGNSQDQPPEDRESGDGLIGPSDVEDALITPVDGGNRTLAAQPYPSLPPVRCESWNDLPNALEAIVRGEGPISEALLINRLRDAVGWEKTSGPLRAQFLNLMRSAVADERVHKHGDAYIASPEQTLIFRDWSTMGKDKKPELISDVEALAALAQVVKVAYGVSPEDASAATWRLLGIARVSGALLERGRALVEETAKRGLVEIRDGLVYMKSG